MNRDRKAEIDIHSKIIHIRRTIPIISNHSQSQKLASFRRNLGCVDKEGSISPMPTSVPDSRVSVALDNAAIKNYEHTSHCN